MKSSNVTWNERKNVTTCWWHVMRESTKRTKILLVCWDQTWRDLLKRGKITSWSFQLFHFTLTAFFIEPSVCAQFQRCFTEYEQQIIKAVIRHRKNSSGCRRHHQPPIRRLDRWDQSVWEWHRGRWWLLFSYAFRCFPPRLGQTSTLSSSWCCDVYACSGFWHGKAW